MDRIYYSGLSPCNYFLYLYVRMVYLQGKEYIYQYILLFMPVFYDCTVSDGHVSVVQNCQHASFEHTMGADYCISGIWRRACSFHVHWICQINSAGD